MDFLVEKLEFDKNIEKRIKLIASFNMIEYEIINGKILNFNNCNLNLLEAHKVIFKIGNKDLVVLIFNVDNIFIYNLANKVSFNKLETIIADIRKKVLKGGVNL